MAIPNERQLAVKSLSDWIRKNNGHWKRDFQSDGEEVASGDEGENDNVDEIADEEGQEPEEKTKAEHWFEEMKILFSNRTITAQMFCTLVFMQRMKGEPS